MAQAISKVARYGANTNTVGSLAEEIADVLIVICHMMHQYSITDDCINKIMSQKLTRVHKEDNYGI